MLNRKSGFTILELVIALLIGSLLTSIAFGGIKGAQGRYAIRGAKNTYASLHARARAIGIERGTTIAFIVDTAGDSAFVFDGSGNTEVIRFAEELAVDLVATPVRFRICMTPRGYADPDCSTTDSPIQLEFWQNADSTSVTILPMGQLVGL
jgi:prepilin-type N-terminal cleavage/methylation domain-containing protein